MATRRYSLGKGEPARDVVEGVGAATATKSIELTVDLAANNSQQDVLQALTMFRDHIVSQAKWPPA